MPGKKTEENFVRCGEVKEINWMKMFPYIRFDAAA